MAILGQDMNDADQLQEIGFWRSIPVWRKLHIMGDLYEAAQQLALADLRRQHPDLPYEQLYALLIERRRLLEALERAA